jgi:hypothetical protein
VYTKRVVFLYKVGGWLYVLVMNTAIFIEVGANNGSGKYRRETRGKMR